MAVIYILLYRIALPKPVRQQHQCCSSSFYRTIGRYKRQTGCPLPGTGASNTAAVSKDMTLLQPPFRSDHVSSELAALYRPLLPPGSVYKYVCIMICVFQCHKIISVKLLWTPQVLINYASHSLVVVFLHWCDSCAFVLFGNKMHFNWFEFKCTGMSEMRMFLLS